MKDHVIAVPTPVAEGKGVIVSNAAGDFSPKSLADVGDRIIGTVHAVRWHEALKKHLKTPRTSAKYGLLIKQLMANRIDGFLIDNVTLGRIIKANVISKDKLRISPPILDLSAYVLLHKKNAKFIPDLDKAIKSVKLEGGFTLK
ncbi:MAG: substrate-binding periplasmic protein [Methyloligellaceae bacterium]